MIKGPSGTSGYFNNPELNATMIRNGWMALPLGATVVSLQ